MGDLDGRGAGEPSAGAQPLRADDPDLPDHIKSYLFRAQTHWLKNTEVLSILQECSKQELQLSSEPPIRPPGGSIFLFDRKVVRFFRKDGHNWRKKADGKTVRETHEKLKVGNVEMLNCYYAHSEREDGPQRRCYWQLESEDDIVLVHYLVVDRGRASNNEPVAALQSSGGSDILQSSGLRQSAPGLEPLDVMFKQDPEQDLSLPAISMDSFMAVFDDQDTLQQQLRQDQYDEYADKFLPEFHELVVPVSGHGEGVSGLAERDWQGGSERMEDLGALPSHVVQTGESVRLIEPGFQGGMPDWGGHGLNVLGTPQMSHDARQSLRKGPSLTRGTARLSFEDSLYATKHDQLKKMATAMQSMGEALQGVAGSFPRPPNAALLQQQAQFPFRGEGQHAPPNAHQHSFATDLQTTPPATSTAIPATPKTSIRPSPFGAQAKQIVAPSISLEGHVPYPMQQDGQMDAKHSKLGTRSISMELPSMSNTPGINRGVTWKDALPAMDLGEDIGGSKARGRAFAANKALALESQLSELDRDLMCHIRQPSGGLQNEAQVRAFEDRLQRLEGITTNQLLRHRSSPAPFCPEDLFLDTTEGSGANDNSILGACSARLEDAMDDGGSAPAPFEILDYTPEWDFTSGGSKLMVACSFTRQDNVDVSNARLHVMFDKEQVLATVLRPGVIRVTVPPHDVGTVELKLTFGDGKARSCSVPFTYRINPQSARSADTLVCLQMPDRELQHRLINMLTGGPSQPSSEQDSAACSSGSGHQNQSTRQTAGLSQPVGSGDAVPLAGLSMEQGERLLAGLIERWVQHYATEVANGRHARMQWGTSLAIAAPSCLNHLHETGQAMIHLLAGLGLQRAVDILIAAGANPSLQDAWGYTPLHWAAARGKAEAVVLLLARKASAKVLTFLAELQPRLSPADTAGDSGNSGIAAFLGEQQLAQGVAELKTSQVDTPDSSGASGLTTQRKRSRHLPQTSEGQTDPLLDMDVGDSPSADSAGEWHSSLTERGSAIGKENLLDHGAILSRAKQNAETLENAILRKHARKALRTEKRLRAQKREAEALQRIQQRRAHWDSLQQLASVKGHSSMQSSLLQCYLVIGQRIAGVQTAIEGALRAHAAAVEKVVQVELPASSEVADYGSDSDVTMAQSVSIQSQRKLQHMHKSRRLDGRSSLPKTADQDIRSILKAGAPLGEDNRNVVSRSRSKSTISQALAHVERLRTDENTKRDYAKLKEALSIAAAAPQKYSFKFARTDELLKKS